MDFKIVPYVEVDGIRTFKDSTIMSLFDHMEKDGTVEIVFFEGLVKTREQFLAYMKQSDNHSYLFLDGKDISGFAWVNNLSGRSAQLHWCMFKEWWGRSLEVGIRLPDVLTHTKDAAGEYIIDVLTTIVPNWNKKALKFAEKNGAIPMGTIPNILWNHYKNKSEDGTIFHYTRMEERL